jgi:hypothetical protein
LTEVIVLRVIVLASLVWFAISEWRHHQQLEHAYKRGFDKAIKTAIKKIEQDMKQFINEFQEDLNILAKAVQKHDDNEQANETRTGEA